MGVMWAAYHCLQGHVCSVTLVSAHLDLGVCAGRTEWCSIFREVRSRQEDPEQKTQAFSRFRGRILLHLGSPARSVRSEVSTRGHCSGWPHFKWAVCLESEHPSPAVHTPGEMKRDCLSPGYCRAPFGPWLGTMFRPEHYGMQGGWGDGLRAAGAGPQQHWAAIEPWGLEPGESPWVCPTGRKEAEGERGSSSVQTEGVPVSVYACVCVYVRVCACVYACMCVSKENSVCMRLRGDRYTRCFPQRSFDYVLFWKKYLSFRGLKRLWEQHFHSTCTHTHNACVWTHACVCVGGHVTVFLFL